MNHTADRSLQQQTFISQTYKHSKFLSSTILDSTLGGGSTLYPDPLEVSTWSPLALVLRNVCMESSMADMKEVWCTGDFVPVQQTGVQNRGSPFSYIKSDFCLSSNAHNYEYLSKVRIFVMMGMKNWYLYARTHLPLTP